MDTETFTVAATGGFLTFIGGVLGVLLKHFTTSKTKTTIESQPIDVRLAKDFVSKDDFKSFLETYRNDIIRIFERIETQQKDNSDIRAGVAQQLGSLDGTLKSLSATIQSMQQKGNSQ